MPKPTSAKEWAKFCRHSLSSGHDVAICLKCARAYARQQVEAWRERAAQTLDAWVAAYPEDIWTPLTEEDWRSGGSLIDRAGAQTGRHIGKVAAADLRALPVEDLMKDRNA